MRLNLNLDIVERDILLVARLLPSSSSDQLGNVNIGVYGVQPDKGGWMRRTHKLGWETRARFGTHPRPGQSQSEVQYGYKRKSALTWWKRNA